MELLIIGYVICFICFPFVRFITFNIHRVLYSSICSAYDYIRCKRWNECRDYGKIKVYTGLFGQGKTKECVRHITSLYKAYNGKKIWNPDKQEWVSQIVIVYSNVQLAIPYIELTSMQQMVDCQHTPFGIVNLFLIDEASVVFNSRDYKNNFSTPALNTILTCRHHRIGIFLTSQRFGHLDALLRQVISEVYDCKYSTFTRIQRIKMYDAYDLEYCSSLSLVKPLSIRYYWTSKKVYDMYDTYAMVQDVGKKCTSGHYISDNEVLESQGTTDNDISMVSKVTRKAKKRMQ